MTTILISNSPDKDHNLAIPGAGVIPGYPRLHAHWRRDADGKLVSFWHADKH